MISYNSQITRGSYKIQIETDDYIVYQQVQEFIRKLIDDKNKSKSKNVKEEKENPFKTEWCLLPV